MELVEESIHIARELGDRFQLGWALFTRGLIAMRTEQPQIARDSYAEAMQIFRETGDLTGYVLVLDGFAGLEWSFGDRDKAMRLAGAAVAIQDVTGLGLAQVNRQNVQFYPEELLQEAPLANAYAEGKKLTQEQAIELALGQDGH